MNGPAPSYGLAEYGLLGAAFLALLTAVLWFMRTTTTQLLGIVKDNTAALTALQAALQGKIVTCPYAGRHAVSAGDDDAAEVPQHAARARSD